MLVITIVATVSAYVLSGTLLDAHYWQSQAQNTRLYANAARSLPATLAPGSGPEAQAAQQAVAGLVTSHYLETKLSPYLDGLVAFLHGDGSVPELDFNDLTLEASRQGLPAPASAILSAPVATGNANGLKALAGWVGLIRVWGVIIGLGLATLVFLLNRGWHRFLALAKICWAAAATQGLLYLLLKLAPGMLDSLVESKATVSPLAQVLADFFKELLAGVGSAFGWAGIILVTAGFGLLIIGLIARAVGFFTRHKNHSDDRYIRPNPDNRPTL